MLRSKSTASTNANPRRGWMAVAAAILVAAFVLYVSKVEPVSPVVRQVEYASARLPRGFEGFRIVQLSDLHLGSFALQPGVVRRIVEQVNALNPQLILFTGDLVNRRSSELAPFLPVLSQLQATHGVYAVMGNHDYGDYYRWPSSDAKRNNLLQFKKMVAQMGWHLLDNAHCFIHCGGDSIALLGVENEGEPPFPQYGDLPRALQGTGTGFKLLMSHNPIHWRSEVLPESDVDLTLSGHTHAMQSIVWGRSLAELKYPEWHGFYYEGDRALYVNIGLGYVGFAFRFNAPPEITLLTLSHS